MRGHTPLFWGHHREEEIMHVGYGSGFQHLGGYSDRRFMREELGNCLMAEELGMDSISTRLARTFRS
jgi:hypothetical protein